MKPSINADLSYNKSNKTQIKRNLLDTTSGNSIIKRHKNDKNDLHHKIYVDDLHHKIYVDDLQNILSKLNKQETVIIELNDKLKQLNDNIKVKLTAISDYINYPIDNLYNLDNKEYQYINYIS